MRFLGIGMGVNQLYGSATLTLSAVGSISRLGVIAEGIPSVCPVSMLQASNGTLLVASGLGPMMRMRYNERTLTTAGVPAPVTAITLLRGEDYDDVGTSITDPLTGRPLKLITFDFSIYGSVRSNFVGQHVLPTPQGQLSQNARWAIYSQNFNNIAAIISSELNSTGDGANGYAMGRVSHQLFDQHGVDANGNTATPVVTYLWNNLTGSFYVYDTTTSAAIDGQYQCFQRWVDKDGYVSDPGPLSNLATISSKNVVKYNDVEVPTDSRIVRRQIWRNDAGQLQNFYLDIDTDDLTSTSFESTKTDAQLVLCDLVTFTNVDGYTIPYLYGQPPADKPFIAELRGRIFAVGSRRYSKGSAQVSNGSTTVTGIGTGWTKQMAGRRFIAGTREYLITTLDDDTQIAIIDPGYLGESDNFALYTIAPYAAEELVVRWSDVTAGPESWPLTAQLLLPQDGDTITGLINYGDALYITKTRNIYRLNFSEDPAVDGSVTPAAKRGCINFRCAVSVEGACYMLDREGIHAFVGGPDPTHISIPIADIFREENDGYRINWDADTCFWHAILHQEISTIKWYVTLAGDTFPQNAICFDYRRGRFWLEEYPRPISASCYSLAVTGRPLLGTTEGKVLAADTGSLDLIEPGNTLLTVLSANSPWSVTFDTTPKECTGVPAVFVTGGSAGVDRIITWQEGSEVQFGTPLDILPQKGDKVQLGGVRYKFKTASFFSERLDGQQPISLSVYVDPDPDAELYGQLTIYKNGDKRSTAEMAVARSYWGAGTRDARVSSKFIEMDMASELGVIKENLDKQSERDTPKNFEWQFRIDGSSGETKPRVVQINVEGAG